MADEKKHLIVIDSNSIIHRAYHALPQLTTQKGEIVNAIYGFLLVLFKAIRDFQPDFIAACFDFPGPTFRHKRYKEYKAKRPKTPEDLSRQIPGVKEILRSFDIPIFEKEGFEADDIIGTIAVLADKEQATLKIETTILSGDLDSLQLVSPQTRVYSLKRGVKDIILYDEKRVQEQFGGLTSKHLLDFKALRGDPSDNIPGVVGIGEKTAIELLLKFDTLENLYEEIKKDSEGAKKLRPKLKKTLIDHKGEAFLSKELAKLNQNVPIDFNFKNCSFGKYNKERVVKTLEDLEFYSLIKRIPGNIKNKAYQNEPSIGENLRLW